LPTAQKYRLALKPYLEDAGPNSNGEWGMHCPFHDDRRRSASVNFDTGLWYCNACNVGGTVRDLTKQIERNSHSINGNSNGNHSSQNGQEEKPKAALPTEEQVAAWHSVLMYSTDRLDTLRRRRGLTKLTIRRWQIGWDQQSRAYTIPIRNEHGDLANIRFYRFDPPNGRRKIWSLEGYGTPMLFPLEVISDDEDIVICEGEWDALLTLQKGFTAVTRTGSAKTWDTLWNKYFQDKDVYLIHDMDRDGQAANMKLMDKLAGVAAEVHIVKLPYEVTEDHGKDLTDFWLEPHNLGDFVDLLSGSLGDLQVIQDDAIPVNAVNVLNSFDSAYVGQPLKMRVTITGKRTPAHLAPEDILYTCTQDAGPKCMICPMRGYSGIHRSSIEACDPIILEIMGSTNSQVTDLLRNHIEAQKCSQLKIEVLEYRAVEELYVRPSVELARVQYGETSDFTHRKIISVGRHDSLPNNTVEMVGTIWPNPRGQANEFQAWEVTKTETSIDKFEITDNIRQLLDVFKPRPGQRPIAKLGEIARDLAAHVTKIYGRNDVHALMDLVWHSAMSFYFGDVQVHRGWLEALIVGDTRTGKSEIAGKIIQHYGAGEYVSCESASFAGIVGGLQQLGSGREWEVTWGAIPINDRRLVVLDEVSGLSLDAIQSMSSIRSSGEAQLTKIRSERTWARTRLVWLGNPRETRMDAFTYGVQAIKPLIGNNEDIARFDLAMSLRSDDVSSEDMNREHQTARSHIYTEQACQVGVLWAWSRRPEHISFTSEATDRIYHHAIDLGSRYVETPPLVQSANIRIKLARLAVAFAIRTVSTDASYEQVIVTRQHVDDAVVMIDNLYGHPGFGYKEYSEECLRDAKEALANRDKVKAYLTQNRGMAKFFRKMGHFRRQDMEDMLNYGREEANAKINQLWKWRMFSRDGQDIGILPVLHDILREVEE
jgi:hypothetical protein